MAQVRARSLYIQACNTRFRALTWVSPYSERPRLTILRRETGVDRLTPARRSPPQHFRFPIWGPDTQLVRFSLPPNRGYIVYRHLGILLSFSERPRLA